MRNDAHNAKALTPEDLALLDRLLGNPLQLPQRFKSWLVSYLGPELTITQSQLLNATTGVYTGTGSPEGILAAGIGSLYLRLDGSAGTTIYTKESGQGTTGWVGRDVFTNGLTVSDGKDITVSSGTGTKLGQITSKLGFFGATPVVQQALTTDLLDALQALGLVASGAGNTPLNLTSGALTAGTVNGTALQVSGVALASTHLSDTAQLLRTTDTYSSYTPTLTAATVNPTLGSGSSVMGRYIQRGKLVHCHGAISFGTSGTAQGTGDYYVSLPVNVANSGVQGERVGIVTLVGSGLGHAHAVIDTGSPGRFLTQYPSTWPAGVSATAGSGVPWVWTTSYAIMWNVIYEAA